MVWDQLEFELYKAIKNMNQINCSTVYELLDIIPDLLTNEVGDRTFEHISELLKTSDRENVREIYRTLAAKNSFISESGRKALNYALRIDAARIRNFEDDDGS